MSGTFTKQDLEKIERDFLKQGRSYFCPNLRYYSGRVILLTQKFPFIKFPKCKQGIISTKRGF